MAKYAILKNSMVLNVIEADSSFIQSLIESLKIDSAVDVSNELQTVNVGDKYVDGVFTTALSKPQAIARRNNEFMTELWAWRDMKYSANVREGFRTLLSLAIKNGLTNRENYVTQLEDWAEDVILFARDVAVALQAQSTATDVLAYQWDFSSLDISDPKITLLGAIQISD